MEEYDWPGNVRQLTHSMEFAVNTAQGGHILRGQSKAALSHHKGNILQAARALGIGRNTLYAKLRKLGIQG